MLLVVFINQIEIINICWTLNATLELACYLICALFISNSKACACIYLIELIVFTCLRGCNWLFQSRSSRCNASSHSRNLAVSCSRSALRFSFCNCSSSLMKINRIGKPINICACWGLICWAPVVTTYRTVPSAVARSSSNCLWCLVSNRCCSCKYLFFSCSWNYFGWKKIKP